MNPAVRTYASFAMCVECVGNKFNPGTSSKTDKKSCMLVELGVRTGLSFSPWFVSVLPRYFVCDSVLMAPCAS